MFKSVKKVLGLTVAVMAMVATVTGCSLKEKNAAEKVQEIVDAYQNGDFETFKSRIDEDSYMHYMMDGLDDENAEGMVEVYQKLYELTKTAEFTILEENIDTSTINDSDITITIKTVDFTNALNEAMLEAIEESGEAFADMPGWMLEALNTGGEVVEKEVVVSTAVNGSLEGKNVEFMQALTGGFYDYIPYTMTSCIMEDGGTYMLARFNAVKISMDDYIYPFDGAEYTDEEVDAVISGFAAQYEDLDGIFAGGNKTDDGIRLYMIVNYDTASSYTLQRLGFVSGSYDYISLKQSIESLESEGYTCETTDFGSGVLAGE